MKLHYCNILLFVIPLNILADNKNKIYITPNHTQTNRSLCECDTQSSNYNNDAEIKSLKESFDRQTSQRFEEYQVRMKNKRQKRKEERDKNIQKIIEKDKMEKSLTEKIEKGCLRCGCALGGGVLPVWGLVSGLWYATLSQHVTKMAIQKGIAEGLKVGLENVMKIANLSLSGQTGATMPTIKVADLMAVGKFNDEVTLYGIFECINSNMKGQLQAGGHELFSTTVKIMAQKPLTQFNSEYSTQAAAVENAFADAKAAEFAAKTGLLSNTIIASIVTIIIIVLIMVIIYLVLRYRRKKKMNKKAQYTKLLEE
ncbi:rifin [Plasmodium reichenowi]|uniref:Rifin n=1 Tax=Plasmodium reichenowi TaxID=5854 RepID=A0A060RMC1_PLARE|nr:rifin [Plasmodium reichenowi]